MSMVFKFRMLSGEAEEFIRDYEVMYDMSLLDFHDFICDDLEYDETSFCSFFMSDAKWSKLQEYTLVDMDDELDDGVVALPMQETILGQIIHGRHDRLIFMFDIFADRSMFLELSETREREDGVSYPRVAFSQGAAPAQFNAESLISDDSPFNDIMEEFSEFGGTDDYDDDF